MALIGTTTSSATETGVIDFSTITQTEVVAPAVVWFTGEVVSGFPVSEPATETEYDPTMHEVFWVWGFDDAGTFSAPLNMPAVWNNKNVAYQKEAVHVFDTPGTYDVTLWAVSESGGVVGSPVTKTVTVLDPDAVYSGTRTICVSNQSDFTGAPAGSQQVTTLAAARTAYRALGQTGRILLRAGETFEEATYVIGDPQDNHIVGSFGSGAKPILKPLFDANGGGTQAVFQFDGGDVNFPDSVFYDLDFQGDWDATTETGDPRGATVINHNGAFQVQWNTLYHSCKVSGMGTAISAFSNEVDGYQTVVNDCDLSNWFDYGLFHGSRLGTFSFSPNARLAIVGTSSYQPPDCCYGQHAKNGHANQHGPFRHVDTRRVLLQCVDFHSANSWTLGVQGCLRLAQRLDEGSGWHFRIFADRIALEGGDGLLATGGAISSETTVVPHNSVFDHCLLVNGCTTGRFMSVNANGTTIRNVYMVELDMVPAPGKEGAGVRDEIIQLTSHPSTSSAANDAARVNIKHWTFLGYHNTAFDTIDSSSGLTDYVNDNFIKHQVNVSGGQPFAPVDLTQNVPDFVPRHKGLRQTPARISATATSVGNGGTLTFAYPSGTAAADFSGSTRNGVELNGDYYMQHRSELTIVFGGSNITVTNTSSDTWSGTVTLMPDQTSLVTDSQYASGLTSIPYLTPAVGSPAIGAGDPGPYSDLLLNVTPGPSETGMDHTGALRAATGRNEGAIQEVAS